MHAQTPEDSAAPDAEDDFGDGSDANLSGLMLRAGVDLLSAVLVGLAIGWGLDRWLGTKPLLLIVMVLLGGVAGLVNVWRSVSSPDVGKTGGRAGRPRR